MPVLLLFGAWHYKTKHMIEIKLRNGNWECYIDGGLFHYDEYLDTLLSYLASRSEVVIDMISENNS